MPGASSSCPAARLQMNSKWENPDQWAANLINRLSYRAKIYELEPDVTFRRNKAAAMVGEIAKALMDLPGSNTDMLLPLKDIMIFSEDMQNGLRHPWSKTSGNGTSLESIAKTEFRQWVIVAVLALIDGGHGRAPSYKIVAAAVERSGRAVSWRGIQGWVRAFETGTDRRLLGAKKLYDQRWANAPCPHGSTLRDCPHGKAGTCPAAPAASLRFVEWVAQIPHLRDRFEP